MRCWHSDHEFISKQVAAGEINLRETSGTEQFRDIDRVYISPHYHDETRFSVSTMFRSRPGMLPEMVIYLTYPYLE